jgi:TIR domain/Effector-associated domain 8
MTCSTSQVPAPKAFISYAWDDDAHSLWVKDFATRLRGDGVDVTLDRWHAAPGDQIPSFMERAVRENDFVIAVCTPRYKSRSDLRAGGVGYEGDIMTAEVFTSANQRKFIPVLRSGNWNDAAPSWLLGRVYIDLRGDPYSEFRYEELLRALHGAREVAPPIGPRPDFGADKTPSSPTLAPVLDRPVARTPTRQLGKIEDEIRAVLRPLMGDRNSRLARLTRAFAAFPGLLGQINVDDAPAVFLDLLINTLREYGEVEAGKPAVCVLLESVKGEVGLKDRQRIERIVSDFPC